MVVYEHTRCCWTLETPALQSWGLLLFVGHPTLTRSPLLMFGVLSSLAAAGERPDALPQAAECTDRPGLSQTQTGQRTVTLLMSYSSFQINSESCSQCK